MKRLYIILLTLFAALSAVDAQRTLTLDECRRLAVDGNKKLAAAKVKGDIAANVRQATNTLSLPRMSAVLGYEHFGREVSLLNNSQKAALPNIGTTATGALSQELPGVVTQMVAQGLITAQQAQSLSGMLGQSLPGITDGLNAVGNDIKNALRTDTRNMYAGAIMVTQPVYMGGAINTAKEMAKITEEISATTYEQTRQNTVYDIDKAYWLVVQLAQKKKLADRFEALVSKLNDDVQKCIDEGVATRADGLKVSVALNEAQMTQLQVEDGVKLAKMLICQLCGLPIDTEITLADEALEAGTMAAALAEYSEVSESSENPENSEDFSNRPELHLLEHTVELSKEAQNLIKATNRPQILATAGVLVTNPSPYNGFEKKFAANWNVGVMARIPIWNWKENTYKLNAAKATTTMATLELEEATELIDLQVAQNKFKIAEAQRRLSISEKNIEKAEENMRCANLGFSEGVMTSTDVMAAQTAWLQAETQRIDAQIELLQARLSLRKNLGRL